MKQMSPAHFVQVYNRTTIKLINMTEIYPKHLFTLFFFCFFDIHLVQKSLVEGNDQQTTA